MVLTDSPTVQVSNGTINVPSGFTIYDNEQIETSVATGSKVISNLILPTSYPNSYYTSIHLGKTESNGDYIGSFDVINVDPATSPYLTCPGCTTVNPTHLVFGHANFATALETVIANAVLTISGDVDLVDFSVLKSFQIYLSTKIKHNPSGIYHGFKSSGPNAARSYATWHNELTGSKVTNYLPQFSGWNFATGGEFPAQVVNLNGPNGTISVSIDKLTQTSTVPPLNGQGDFYEAPFASPSYNLTPVTYTVLDPLTSSKVCTITVTVQASTNPAYAISITDSDDNFVAGSIAQPLTYSTSTLGDYTVTITGAGGCQFTETITLE